MANIDLDRRKKLIVYILSAIAVFILLMIFLMFLPRGGHTKVIAQIPKGSTTGEIADILADKGIIRSPFGFRLLAYLKHSASKMQPGAYELDSSMSPSVIINKIARGETVSRWLTIPEGYTIEQIATKIQKEGLGNAEIFYKLAAEEGDSFNVPFPSPGKNLEGYLFPDTYLIPIGSDEKEIINQMLNCFNEKVYEKYAPDIAASGMTLHEIITLASLIEREAKKPEDRAMISSVLHNRLKNNMKLAVDASVLYALGRHKNRVLYRDLEIDSPYNTYKYAGLPPGPIANPGIEAIKAAIHPAKSDYLFYVAKSDGSHVFSKTFDEHKRAIMDARKGGE